MVSLGRFSGLYSLEKIQFLEEWGIAGNYDSTVATDYKHCRCKAETAYQEELSHLSYEWTRSHVTPETTRALGELPFRMELRPTVEGCLERIGEDDPEDEALFRDLWEDEGERETMLTILQAECEVLPSRPEDYSPY